MLLRRLAAVALLGLAVLFAMREDPATRQVDVVVAVRDLPPGHALADEDVRLASRPAAGIPEAVIHEVAAVRGATLAAAVSTGEMLTDVRVVGPRLAAVASGAPDARIVPIRLADNAVAEILRAGDRVDVVAGEESGSGGRPARLLASDAAVVLVSGSGADRGKSERVVLVALDARRAATVAAASLRTALTVVFH